MLMVRWVHQHYHHVTVPVYRYAAAKVSGKLSSNTKPSQIVRAFFFVPHITIHITALRAVLSVLYWVPVCWHLNAVKTAVIVSECDLGIF